MTTNTAIEVALNLFVKSERDTFFNGVFLVENTISYTIEADTSLYLDEETGQVYDSGEGRQMPMRINISEAILRDTGGVDNNDVATGTTLINVQKKFRISFNAGTSDVRFFVDDDRVAAGTTFDMSNYTAGLQPYFQLQKTSDNNADAAIIDYVHIVSRRA